MMSKNNVYRNKQRQTKPCTRKKKEQKTQNKSKEGHTRVYVKKGGSTRHRAEQGKKNKGGGVVGGVLKESERA